MKSLESLTALHTHTHTHTCILLKNDFKIEYSGMKYTHCNCLDYIIMLC